MGKQENRKMKRTDQKGTEKRPVVPRNAEEWKAEGMEWVRTIIFVMAVFLPIFFFVVQGYRIPSGSMKETLQIGDFLFADKITYGARIPLLPGKRMPGLRDPEPRDIVIFKSPKNGDTLIKRCVAVGGQVIELRNQKLYIDNQPVDEPYTIHTQNHVPQDNFGPYRVEPGYIICFGDNRHNSSDSRVFGPVPVENVIAKADILYWSWHWDWGKFFSLKWDELQAPRLNRVGKLLTK